MDSLKDTYSLKEVVHVVTRLMKAIGKCAALEPPYLEGQIQDNSKDCGCFTLYSLIQIAQEKVPRLDEIKLGIMMRKYLLSVVYSRRQKRVSYPF